METRAIEGPVCVRGSELGGMGILGRENIKRQAARKRRNSGDGPAANQRTGNASGRVVVGAPERKLPRVVHNQTMRDVEFGVAALGRKSKESLG